MTFILAQICGFIAFILTVVSVHFKSKEKIIIASILANISVSIQFFLLGALTGGIISVINTIRGLVFYFYKKKNRKAPLSVLIVFEAVCVIAGVLTWQNTWSILPILNTCFYTYSLWQDNIKVIRIATGIVGFSWAIYDLIVKAFVGFIQESAQCVSAIMALCRYRTKKERDKKE